jgi:hypothetical protein
MRLPKDRPDFAQVSSFKNLSDSDLKILSQQKGMAGRTKVVGSVATWSHEIDFQPPDGTTDTGRLEVTSDGGMFEHGLDGSYTEAWELAKGPVRPYLAIRIERSGRVDRFLIVARDRFMFVRNRANNLPAAESLEALISTTNATRNQIIEYLDCEFSTGGVPEGRAPWVIEKSTLPWRQGRPLELVDEIKAADFVRGMGRHNSATERWTVAVNTFSSAEIRALFGTNAAR